MKKQPKKTKKPLRKSPVRKAFSFYQVVSSSSRFNFGAFPASKEGLGLARDWAEKMSQETGEKCVVKRK